MAYVADDYWLFDYIDENIFVLDETRTGGWLPLVYLDRKGNRVNLDEKIAEVAVAAIDELKPALAKKTRSEANAIRRDILREKVTDDYSARLDEFIARMGEIDKRLQEMVIRDMRAAEQMAMDDETIIILMM